MTCGWWRSPDLSADAGGVVLRVSASGICGSDLHMLIHGPFGKGLAKVIDGYRILGHDSAARSWR
jgi:threonine dehydrogenase-like Zn-dependent dehydrogenase